MNRNSRDVDCERNSGDADLEQTTMESAQAGNDARRDPLACHLGAGTTQPYNAAATTQEPAHARGSAPVILEASKTALVQQFRWQRALDECGAFLWREELAGG